MRKEIHSYAQGVLNPLYLAHIEELKQNKFLAPIDQELLSSMDKLINCMRDHQEQGKPANKKSIGK